MAVLKAIIERLLAENEFLRNGRKSKTSHTPPSQDIGRSNQNSLREKSDKPTGGQKGHEGNTLLMSEKPDEVKEYHPGYCTNCGADISQEPSELIERKQEVELPPIQAQYIEHRNFKKQCVCCGQVVKSRLPAHLKASIQYGATVAATIGYLSVYQCLPYQRLTALLKSLFHLPISEGSVQNILERLSANATPAYQLIQQKVADSKVVGSDETGASIGGKKAWFFTWQNESSTFLSASFSRGYDTILKLFPKGLPQSVLVSDCWAAQLKTPAQQHQLCIAHLLRELINFETALNCQWSINMKGLLQDALDLKKQLKPLDYHQPDKQVQQIETRLHELLATDLSGSHKRVQALLKRLQKHRDSIFTFLHHPKVPPDNNASERAIRNLKVKNKISGSFRSEKGARQFAVLRSVVDTAIKNTCSVFDAFFNIAIFSAE